LTTILVLYILIRTFSNAAAHGRPPHFLQGGATRGSGRPSPDPEFGFEKKPQVGLLMITIMCSNVWLLGLA